MNSFGRLFRVTIFGESHGSEVGIVIDGCPPGIPLSAEDFEADLQRRKPGAAGTTPRKEEDLPSIVSGTFNGMATGAPLTIIFNNQNVQSKDYEHLKRQPRPGHADFVLSQKFKGFNDYRGGGHSSGRLTVAITAAGVVAKKFLDTCNSFSLKEEKSPIIISAVLVEAGGDPQIKQAVERAIEKQDSIGGIVECKVSGLPPGLGEPFFDSVESLISHAIFSIPAIKGIEFGSGFRAAKMSGKEHNDVLVNDYGTTATNNAGGINGGISNGNDLVFRVAVKPTSSTAQSQKTWNLETQKMEPLIIGGRHDVCIALRVPVVVEAVTAIVLADLFMLQG